MKNAASFSLARLIGMRPALILLALAGSCFCCFGQLPTDLDLPSETLDSGYLVFQASNSITNSGANFAVQDPASVTLTAGSYIKLEPGFEAVATTGTATFQAVINPNVTQWQPIPVPPPPTPCTDCGEDFALAASSGISPQATFAPNSRITGYYAYCLDQNGYSVPCNISLSVASYLGTNGHYHYSPLPPTSGISPSSGYTGNYPDFAMPTILTTTQVGQFETVSATPTDCDNGEVGETCIETNFDYAVGYQNLVYIGNSNIFAQIGATAIHGGSNYWNHWMTVPSATNLQGSATAYINNNNPGQKICINDMSLPLGGKFDLNANWGSPHSAHDWGTAADVAVKSVACSAISLNYLVNSGRFQNQCTTFGATEILLECTDRATGITRRPCAQCLTTDKSCHVHCRWTN